jgi:hypothetical protein
MKQHFKDIQLEDIEDNSQYDIHPFLNDAQLNNDIAQSMQMIGLLTPPVIIEKSGGKYEIICGRRRIQSSRSLKRKSCCCQIIGKTSSVETILAIILEDQFANGPLTIIEQAWFIKLCKQLLLENKRLHSFFKSLLPGRITKGNHYLTPLVELDKSIQSAIHHSIMSEKIVTELSHFSNDDQKILLSLIESLHIGGNNQKKLIVQLHDIVKRNNLSLTAFIGDETLQKILLSIKLNRSEKVSKLLEYVGRLYQPLLTSSRESFVKQLKSLRLPENVSIIPSSSFEKDDVTLSVRFRSLEDFKNRWGTLKRYMSD